MLRSSDLRRCAAIPAGGSSGRSGDNVARFRTPGVKPGRVECGYNCVTSRYHMAHHDAFAPVRHHVFSTPKGRCRRSPFSALGVVFGRRCRTVVSALQHRPAAHERDGMEGQLYSTTSMQKVGSSHPIRHLRSSNSKHKGPRSPRGNLKSRLSHLACGGCCDGDCLWIGAAVCRTVMALGSNVVAPTPPTAGTWAEVGSLPGPLPRLLGNAKQLGPQGAEWQLSTTQLHLHRTPSCAGAVCKHQCAAIYRLPRIGAYGNNGSSLRSSRRGNRLGKSALERRGMGAARSR